MLVCTFCNLHVHQVKGQELVCATLLCWAAVSRLRHDNRVHATTSLVHSVTTLHPCVQAVTKNTVSAGAQAAGVALAAGSPKHVINIRDAFVAGPGCVLIAADYSQIELRVLAHLSGDSRLIHILRQAGVSGDAFGLIARTWLRRPHDTGSQQSRGSSKLCAPP